MIQAFQIARACRLAWAFLFALVTSVVLLGCSRLGCQNWKKLEHLGRCARKTAFDGFVGSLLVAFLAVRDMLVRAYAAGASDVAASRTGGVVGEPAVAVTVDVVLVALHEEREVAFLHTHMPAA